MKEVAVKTVLVPAECPSGFKNCSICPFFTLTPLQVKNSPLDTITCVYDEWLPNSFSGSSKKS